MPVVCYRYIWHIHNCHSWNERVIWMAIHSNQNLSTRHNLNNMYSALTRPHRNNGSFEFDCNGIGNIRSNANFFFVCVGDKVIIFNLKCINLSKRSFCILQNFPHSFDYLFSQKSIKINENFNVWTTAEVINGDHNNDLKFFRKFLDIIKSFKHWRSIYFMTFACPCWLSDVRSHFHFEIFSKFTYLTRLFYSQRN